MKHRIYKKYRTKKRRGQHYWVGRKRNIPQGKGTLWHGQDFIHGPRYKKPLEFEDNKFYIVTQDWAKSRHLSIPKTIPMQVKKFALKENLTLPKSYKNKMRLKVGTLKDTNKLGIQSFITPIQRRQ